MPKKVNLIAATAAAANVGTVVSDSHQIGESVRELLGIKPNGYAARMRETAWVKKVAALADLFEAVTHGDPYAVLQFKEAMTVSDFPILFGDNLYRTLAQRYAQASPVWRQWAAPKTNRDFRAAKIIDVYGAGATLDSVAEAAPYKQRSMDESSFSVTLGKFGAAIGLTWEMVVNDDLGALARAPQALASAAINTESKTAVSVLVDSSGPKSWLGTADTAALTSDNLQTAIETITDAKDDDGNPIVVDAPILLVPPALSQTAQNIVNTTQVRTTESSKERLVAGNGLGVTPRVVVDPWLTTVNTSGKAKTTWFLLPPPDSARPSVYMTFLAGHETPDLRIKNDAGSSIGGGTVNPMEGSFDNDTIGYRVRHVVGGNEGFDDAVYVSEGS